MAPLVAAPPALAAEDPEVQARADAAALVNPLIGTANGGNVFPGAVLPLGMAPFSPYPGDVTTSPSADATDSVYASTFAHANEVAQAGSYSVGLDSGAKAELTATTRTTAGRFTFPAGKPANMLVRSSNSELVSTDATV